jgi:hypothetical protein
LSLAVARRARDILNRESGGRQPERSIVVVNARKIT